MDREQLELIDKAAVFTKEMFRFFVEIELRLRDLEERIVELEQK